MISISELGAANTISGQILDSHSGEPIIGANVVIVNTDEGAATNTNGQFNIRTAQPYPVTIKISHIAYEYIELTVQGDTVLVIRLKTASVMGKSIIITGERSSIGSDVSTIVEIIDIESIENLGARDIGDVLRPLSSVAIRATNSGKQYISIRGSNANEVAVFLDGLRLNDTNTGIADLSAIDLNDMEQVEVVKGGSSTLFGQGAFGGVVNLTSRLPESNGASYVRGIGETDDVDQDLAYGASVRWGPIAFGGNYSGKSRRYDGNSIYTSMFQSLAGVGYLPWGNISAKHYNLDKYLELSSGTVAQSDQLQLQNVRYNGSLFNSPNWEFFAGRRNWSWVDRFFTNLTRELAETSTSARVGHKLVNNTMSSTIQYDYEEQNFTGEDTFSTSLSNYEQVDYNNLTRIDHGLTGVLRIDTESKSTGFSKIRWEASFRADNFETTHFATASRLSLDNNFDSVYDSTITNLTSSMTVYSRKFGFKMEGSASDLYYSFFVNQGHNSRPPSLNDLSLWANAANAVQGDTAEFSPLKTETLSTTDIGVEIILQPPDYTGRQIELIFGGSVFVNEYDNKIAYRYSERLPPVPINALSTQISGYEVSLGATTPDSRLSAQVGYQKLNIDDPRVYPNKPEYRVSGQVELRYPWLVVGYDFYRDGPQFVLENGLLALEAVKRKSSNANIMVIWKLWKVKMSLAYTIRNIFKDEPTIHSELINQSGQPFQYYETHRKIITFRIRI